MANRNTSIDNNQNKIEEILETTVSFLGIDKLGVHERSFIRHAIQAAYQAGHNAGHEQCLKTLDEAAKRGLENQRQINAARLERLKGQKDADEMARTLGLD